MDDDEITSGIIDSDGYDSYNVPGGIFNHQHNGRHWVHKMYRKLKTPINFGILTKENLCIPCFHSLYGKPRDVHDWKKFVKSKALDNTKNQIKKMHPELILSEPYIQQEEAKKKAKYKGEASMPIVKFMKPSLNKHKVDITIWLYLNGIPFNVSTSPEFRDIHKITTTKLFSDRLHSTTMSPMNTNNLSLTVRKN